MALDLSGLDELVNIYDVEIKQTRVDDIDISKIETDPLQPRKVFDDETLNELADSIKNQGLIQPLLVRQDGDKFVIITGERRFRALEKLGAKTAKCIVRNDIPSEDIPYVQIAENMKRQDLTVVEIAEFICGRMNAGETQTKIAEKLGFSKSMTSQYAAWLSMPDSIKEAIKKGKIKDIQTAYILDGKYQEMPDTVEKLISDFGFISRSQAQNLELNAGGKVSHEKLPSEYDSLNSPLSTSEETLEEDNAVAIEQEEPIGERATDGLDDESDDSGDDSIMSEEEQETEAKDENPASPISHSEETEDFSPTFVSDESTTDSLSDEEDPDKSEELEEAADTILSDDKPEEFKNPVWLCFCDERDCELLWKRKPKADGFVFVKYEDGTEEEVPAELVRLNRVIEA